MGHNGMVFDSSYAAGLPPMNYEAMMALQNQQNQANQQNQHF